MTSGGNVIATTEAPPDGLWRVGLSPDPYETREPLTADELNDPRVGNRFDSPLGSYSVLYFGTSLEACFGETLARFRPDPRLVRLIGDDWGRDLGFMLPGEVPADWRLRRLAVRAVPPPGTTFVDVEAAQSRQLLQVILGPQLALYEALDLDVSVIRGGDRRVTRLISWWAWSQRDDDGTPLYGGIRYLSRLDTDWECWALFDRTATTELERRPPMPNMPELKAVAERYGLRIF